MSRVFPVSLTTRVWPPYTPIGATSRDARRMTLAGGWTLASDPSSIIQSAVDVANGVKTTLQNPAVVAQLPHTGAAYTKAGVYADDNTLITPWFPSLDLFNATLVERIHTGTDPILMRVGIFACNASNPAAAGCTEGFGFGFEFPSTDIRQVQVLRVTGAGVWAAAATGTGRNDHFGVFGSMAGSALAAVRYIVGSGTDANGDIAVPQGTNIAAYTAANQAATGGAGWYTGFYVGWQAIGGTAGVSLTFDPMYWIAQRVGRG